MRWGVVVVGVAITAGPVGCDVSRTGEDASRETSETRQAPSRVGPTDLLVPVELRPVLSSVPSGQSPPPASATPTEPTEELTDDEGTTYTLAEPFLSLRELDGAEVADNQQRPGTFVITLSLTDADSETFGDWTGDHVGEQLAMVVDDEVIFAPTISDAITGGQVEIQGGTDDPYDRDEAEDLLDKITGR